MEYLDQRFQELLKHIEIDDQGRLALMGVRSVITPEGSLLAIMEAANDILGERGSWIIMYRAGYQTARSFAQTMMDVHELDPNQVALAYSDFAHLRGWGFYKLIEMGFTEGQGRIHVYHSIFADYFWQKGGSQRPVCGFVAGALAGITHAVSGVQVRARELQCVAMGAEYCEMTVQPMAA
jgi:predicted hydrocarbon binding protein